MPEPLLHIVIPFFLLTLCGIKIKKSFLMIFFFFTISPDIDVLFCTHGTITHSIVPIILIFVPLVIVTKKYYEKYLRGTILITLAWLSHIFLDVLFSKACLFCPISPTKYHIFCIDQSRYCPILLWDNSSLLSVVGIDISMFILLFLIVREQYVMLK